MTVEKDTPEITTEKAIEMMNHIGELDLRGLLEYSTLPITNPIRENHEQIAASVADGQTMVIATLDAHTPTIHIEKNGTTLTNAYQPLAEKIKAVLGELDNAQLGEFTTGLKQRAFDALLAEKMVTEDDLKDIVLALNNTGEFKDDFPFNFAVLHNNLTVTDETNMDEFHYKMVNLNAVYFQINMMLMETVELDMLAMLGLRDEEVLEKIQESMKQVATDKL